MIGLNDKSQTKVVSVHNSSLFIDVKQAFLRSENKIPGQGETPQNI